MGQRHQLFVVAKIGNRYRPLAAVHHQWLYAEKPPERCLRLLKIFQAEANRIPILQEIRTAQEQNDAFWTSKSTDQPFPFIAISLSVGCSFDPVEGYQERVHLLPFNINLEQVDNNDGITVVDITDLNNPKYCFAFLEGEQCTQALTESEYLSRYEEPDDMDAEEESEAGSNSSAEDEEGLGDLELKQLEEIISEAEDREGDQGLEAYGLIDTAALQTTWTTRNEDLESLSPAVEHEDPRVSDTTILRDSAMNKLLDSLLRESNYDTAILTEAQQLPDFLSKLRGKLVYLAMANELPSSSGIAKFIVHSFSDETSVDLSMFRGMATEHLIEIISNLLGQGKVKSLDLSHLHQLSQADLEKALGDALCLETLYLMNMPQISMECAASIWNRPKSRLTNVYHTELLSRALSEKGTGQPYDDLLLNLKSPLVTDLKNPIKTILFVRINSRMDGISRLRKADGISIDWSRVGPATESSRNDDKVYGACLPLTDVLLSSTRLVTGLVNFFACAEKNKTATDSMGLPLPGLLMAKSIAMAASNLEERGLAVGAIPEIMFRASQLAFGVVSNFWPLPFPNLKMGEWTIVIINEHDPYGDGRVYKDDLEKYRLAIISPKSERSSGGYRVESMESFLGHVLKDTQRSPNEDISSLIQYWTRHTAFVSACDSTEIHDLIPVVEDNTKTVRQSQSFKFISQCWNTM